MNFKDFDDLIHSGIEEIVLKSDIALDLNEESKYSEGIGLDVDNLIIDGAGCSIDAKNKAMIFNDVGNNIILKNIYFKNSFSEDALISNEKGHLTMTDCTFLNTASSESSALFNESVIKIKNCIFKGFHTDEGGTIFNVSEMDIENSYFEGNVAPFGGAIYNDGDLNLFECTFKNNEGGNGGAINNTENLTLKKCSFIENIAVKDKDDDWSIKNFGGAICNFEYMKVEECHFKDNISDYGGAIFNEEDSNSIIANSHFESNNENAIYNLGNLNIRDSCFYLNKGYCGGAIRTEGDLNLVKCKFKDNSATGGGVISNSNTLSLKDCILKDNDAINKGGAIYNDRGAYLIVENSNFSNNSFSGVSAKGGAIWSKGGLNIIDCDFVANGYDCKYCDGGAIWYSTPQFNEKNCNFKDNKPDDISSFNSAYYNNIIEEYFRHRKTNSLNDFDEGFSRFDYSYQFKK